MVMGLLKVLRMYMGMDAEMIADTTYSIMESPVLGTSARGTSSSKISMGSSGSSGRSGAGPKGTSGSSISMGSSGSTGSGVGSGFGGLGPDTVLL